jgi:hypothetical protein
VIPGKFLHLSTPAASHSMRADGIRNHTPEDYVPWVEAGDLLRNVGIAVRMVVK